MSALSKYFAEATKRLTCADLIHPNETCSHQFLDMLWRNIFPICQYYLPTLVIPLVLKINSLNRTEVLQALIDYGKCIFIANWLSTITFSSMCWFHKAVGKFHWHYFVRGPSLIGTLLFYFYPERVKQMQATGSLNMLLETLIKKSNNRIMEILRNSRVASALMFMSFSAIIMTGRKVADVKRFWFTSLSKPSNTRDLNATKTPCVHVNSCKVYVWKAFFKSTKIAVILGLLKFIISNYKRIELTKPTVTLKLLLQNLDYGMMSFTIGYNTLFKYLYCWLNAKTTKNSWQNCMTAGFLAGTLYGVFPKYVLFTYGITESLHAAWQILTKYISNRAKVNDRNWLVDKLKKVIENVDKLPVATIVMAFCVVQLFMFRFQYPYAAPIYVHRFMALGTSKRADQLGERVINIILGFNGNFN